MNKLTIGLAALLAMVGCKSNKVGAAYAPWATPVNITDNTTNGFVATVTDAGALVTTATLSGGTVTATNPSVGDAGAAAPNGVTQIGGQDDAGLLQVPAVYVGAPGAAAPGMVTRIAGTPAVTVSSGTITATNAANGTLGSAAPTTATQVAGQDDAGLLQVPAVYVGTPGATAPGMVTRIAGTPSVSLSGATPAGSNTIGAVTIGGQTAAASFSDQQAAVSGAIKASAGTLFAFACVNRNAANRWLQFFNSTTAPGGGATALFEVLEPAGNELVFDSTFFTIWGRAFATGIAFGHSTSTGTYTAATAGDHDCTFVYQ